MLGFSGFPRQRIIPPAARLAALVSGEIGSAGSRDERSGG
jgi:hypothetical protein